MNQLKKILAMIAEIYHAIENDLPLRPGPLPDIPDLTIIRLIVLETPARV